ncbi:thiamine pyrophosphate-binding protein [Kibdelosporangium aridum]|uniref:Acetolactate synthase-1/2/3 large subunit n=1 Tax=Kibdelosporangium aridum TaxID=2030 RepID=A0A1Y5Y3E3_KIBAR|nr:thiamine pyrophosphate-binding protein [Kibdelosporangium aridum]SMD24274.1 acetolactate synthase-1/2/3 large subunit [Kibdelosporangium aridum]
MPRMSGGEALVRSLAAHDVEVVFGIPGTHNLGIYAHLGIQHVSPRHEQGAGFAADGYARATGKPGVCITTSGPGILNAATAAAQAYSDSVPMLLISPGPPVDHPGRWVGMLHEVRDQSGAMEAVTAGSHRVHGVEEISPAVAQAFAEMSSGRPRPRHLEIPYDLLDAIVDTPIIAPISVSPPVADPTAAVTVLRGAQRPGIIVGGGARGAATELMALATRLGAPVLSTANGKGILPEDHEYSLGAGLHHPAAAEFVAECDVVLAVGTELAPADLWNGPFAFTGKLIRIDIDPAQVVTNAQPDIPLVGDAARTLAAIAGLVEPRTGLECAATWRARIATEAAAEGAAWAPLVDALTETLGRDGILAGDSAMACYYGAYSNLPRYMPGSFLYPTGLGTLGYGLPAAIGAKLGRKTARVAALHGDGGFMFTAPELAAAAALGLPIAVIVVDNGGYGEIRREMVARGDNPVAVDLPSPDFAALARSLGCHGITQPDDLPGALRKAFDADRPTLIHLLETGL